MTESQDPDKIDQSLGDPNQEMVGLGVANLAAAFFQGFPISSSSSRTPVAEAAGARTQLTGVVGALAIALLLLLAPNLLQHLPHAALAAVVGFTQLGLLSGGAAIAAISFAMGIMNNALSRVGAQSVSLTFVTGTLSRVGSHLALALRRAALPNAEGPWDTHLRRALLLARVWAGFLAGALLSGAATPRYGAWVLSAPALILAALAAFDRPERGGLTAPSDQRFTP